MVLLRIVASLSAVTVSAAILAFAPGAAVSAQPIRVRDSAGVRIVENGSRSAAPIAFALAPRAMLDIGGLKANPSDELDTYLRNYSFPVARLSDGGTVIGDRIRLRFFDASGRQTAVAGGAGQGPRDFSQTTSICVTRGDTLVVSDRMNGRISIWTAHAAFVREFDSGSQELPREGCFADGTFLLQRWTTDSTTRMSKLQLERWRTNGTRVADLGDFGGAPPRNSYLSSQATIAAHGDRFFSGDPRAHEVKVHNMDGRLIAIYRTADRIAAVTAAEAEAMQSPAVGAGSGARNSSTTRPKPTHWPAYAAIRTDASGRLWVREYHKAPREPHIWTAFDRDGRMLGKFRIDEQSSYADPFLLAFTAGGAALHTEDTNGAPHVVLFQFVAPGSRIPFL